MMESSSEKKQDIVEFLKSNEFADLIRNIVSGEVAHLENKLSSLETEIQQFTSMNTSLTKKYLNSNTKADEVWAEKVCINRSLVHLSVKNDEVRY